MTDLAEEFIMNGCGSWLLTEDGHTDRQLWAGKVWDFLYWSDDWDETPEVWRPRLILNWEEHKHNSHARKLADFPHDELMLSVKIFANKECKVEDEYIKVYK